jgi:hypothetical protein
MPKNEPPPHPEDLEADAIRAIATGNITLVEQLGDEWRDDHIDCVAVRVHVEGHEPIDTSLWWCGPVIIGALEFFDDSPKAKQKVIKELRGHFENAIDCADQDVIDRVGDIQWPK